MDTFTAVVYMASYWSTQKQEKKLANGNGRNLNKQSELGVLSGMDMSMISNLYIFSEILSICCWYGFDKDIEIYHLIPT